MNREHVAKKRKYKGVARKWKENLVRRLLHAFIKHENVDGGHDDEEGKKGFWFTALFLAFAVSSGCA